MPVTAPQTQFWTLAETTAPDTAALVVAAGNSTRMGGVSKQFLPLLGIPVLIRTLLAFERHPRVGSIIVVTREQDMPELQRLIHQYELTKVTDLVEGGATRAFSVQNGLARCKNTEFVAIHDGARPLVTEAVITRTIEGAVLYGAAAAAVPVKDTIKRADATGQVLETPDRSTLRAMQTPQTFRLSLYQQAAEQCGDKLEQLTDDCAVLEMAGMPVYLVEGDNTNLKITTPEDILLAEAILRGSNGT